MWQLSSMRHNLHCLNVVLAFVIRIFNATGSLICPAWRGLWLWSSKEYFTCKRTQKPCHLGKKKLLNHICMLIVAHLAVFFILYFSEWKKLNTNWLMHNWQHSQKLIIYFSKEFRIPNCWLFIFLRISFLICSFIHKPFLYLLLECKWGLWILWNN